MKDLLKWVILAVVAVVGVAFLSLLGRAQQTPRPPRPQTIYGDDDRLDVYQAASPTLKRLEASTVALFEGYDVDVDTPTGKARLATSSYAQEYGLCKSERFFEQRTGAFCSGSLVAPDVVLTAGHCVTDADRCAGTKFVFGFSIYKDKGATPEEVPASDVYGCRELIGRLQEEEGADWALVRLDRPAADRVPLELSRSEARKGTPLFVIGHPAGLPTKIAGGAAVRDDKPEGYFVANLDTYGGNSGSAVFNAVSGAVEGVLVRGEQDYVTTKDGCRVSKVCPNDGCRGEDVTRISAVLSHLPAAGPSGPPTPAEPPVVRAPAEDAAPSDLRRLLQSRPDFDSEAQDRQ